MEQRLITVTDCQKCTIQLLKFILCFFAFGDIYSRANKEWLPIEHYFFSRHHAPDDFRPSPTENPYFNTLFNTMIQDIQHFPPDNRPIIRMYEIQRIGTGHITFGFTDNLITQRGIPTCKPHICIKQIKSARNRIDNSVSECLLVLSFLLRLFQLRYILSNNEHVLNITFRRTKGINGMTIDSFVVFVFK